MRFQGRTRFAQIVFCLVNRAAVDAPMSSVPQEVPPSAAAMQPAQAPPAQAAGATPGPSGAQPADHPTVPGPHASLPQSNPGMYDPRGPPPGWQGPPPGMPGPQPGMPGPYQGPVSAQHPGMQGPHPAIQGPSPYQGPMPGPHPRLQGGRAAHLAPHPGPWWHQEPAGEASHGATRRSSSPNFPHGWWNAYALPMPPAPPPYPVPQRAPQYHPLGAPTCTEYDLDGLLQWLLPRLPYPKVKDAEQDMAVAADTEAKGASSPENGETAASAAGSAPTGLARPKTNR